MPAAHSESGRARRVPSERLAKRLVEGLVLSRLNPKLDSVSHARRLEHHRREEDAKVVLPLAARGVPPYSRHAAAATIS